MAVFRPSPMLADVAGSVGGLTFQRHRGQHVIMTRARGTNTQSPRQLQQRALGQQVAAAWRALSDAERVQWTAASKIVPGPPDAFGVPKQLSPFAFFLWQQMYVTAATFPPATTPAALTPDTRLSGFTVDTVLGGPWTVTHDSTTGTSSWVGPIFCARPFQDYEPNRWPAERMVGNQRWVDASSPNLLPGFEAAFGAPIEGEYLRFRTLAIQNTGYFKGQSVFYVAQVYT